MLSKVQLHRDIKSLGNELKKMFLSFQNSHRQQTTTICCICGCKLCNVILNISNLKKCNKKFLSQRMCSIDIFYFLFKKSNHASVFMFSLRKWVCRGMFRFRFLLWYSSSAIMLVLATVTYISCSLGKQYRPVLSLSFLDVYGNIVSNPLSETTTV